MKIQNTLQIGIVNTDDDSRFVPNGQLLSAKNFLINSLDGAKRKVGKPAMGNLKMTNTIFTGTSPRVVGVGKNTSKNKVYYFVKDTDFDYLFEYGGDAFKMGP
jgi:hypothetical protein